MVTEVLIATTTNITLSGTTSIQGQTLTAGVSVVLVAGQTDGTQNGPYVVQSGAWTRHTDHDTSAEFVRPWQIFVQQGDYANWRFQFTNLATPTLGTSVLNFDPVERPVLISPSSQFSFDTSTGVLALPSEPEASGTVQVGPLTLTHSDEGIAEIVDANEQRRAYIEGFVPTWNTGSFPSGAPTLSAGAAWLDSPGEVIETAVDTVAIFPNIFAAALHYVYLDNQARPTIDNVVPSSPYFGTARGYSAVGSQARYLCALRSNAGGTAFYNFQATLLGDKRLLMTYLEDTTVSPFRVVSGGTATTNQTVNLGPSGLKLVPASCRVVWVRVGVNATSGVWIDNSEMSTSPAGGSGENVVTTNERTQHVWISLDANQSFRWANVAAGGSTNIDIKKYIDRR